MELVVEKSLMLLFGRWISGNFRSFFFFFPSGRVNVVPHYTTRAAFIDIFYLDYGLLPRHLEY